MSELDIDRRINAILGSGIYNSQDNISSRGLTLKAARSRKFFSAKYLLDISFSVLGLIAIGPFMIMMCALLLTLQGRPIFISHRRIGQNGVLFPCMKFRTMVRDADEALKKHLATNPAARAEWDATRKLKEDPRITPLGSILRKTSIDELPQLFNILRGEMSIVGPRPITVSEADLYGEKFADYMKVRPGLTGLWQISGRNDVSYAERVALDVRYVEEQNFWRDIQIIIKTVPAVLASHGSY
ncbi:sugar transferase [Allorhizobium sp. BGMRC 0089]|uniref:sugar transferase n=1 Tax=Allorhizobium sonneratiae TaxID=2934936 RepID=UPI00203424CA|nr:sugar transferase [Allorhizobium sonneratiae]MCM2293287.1 sugar transferase [Allorhizobium sonneratiae]